MEEIPLLAGNFDYVPSHTRACHSGRVLGRLSSKHLRD